MTPSLEELLFAAASSFSDPGERSAFLDHACREDPALRKRLDELLEFQQQAETFFEFQPELKCSRQPSGAVEAEGIGAHIGRYRLMTRIGSGGCGVVYYAEQEEPVRRKVALKIVKPGMDTEAVIGRFEQERQALAQMDHPNIARVLDAGATASGRPYFVMELVEGEKITEFCDAHRLGVRQRLELFVEVCRAIQHAHQKGIIHRDIKPSNVLVRLQDGGPVPKVIDFGIAKATAPPVTKEATLTHLDQVFGTPAYMSPEQAKGSPDVDTRSDIYSLGVLLYELLSGQIPFELTALSLDELRRVIREEEPKRGSDRVRKAGSEESAAIAAARGTTVPRLIAELEGDLDGIVLKALEKERSKRYETASGLAADVRRFLEDEVVTARPPSRMDRVRKMIRRNKVLVAAACVALFGLVAGLSASTWMYFRERAARQEQARLREDAERLQHAAELRERIAQAAVKVKYGDVAGADELLAGVPMEQTPSSLEAARAFGVVADWHMQAGRLKEAASRYASMVRAIASVDPSDIPSVSVNLLPAAATVAYAGRAEAYEEIRRMAMERFGTTTHGVVAEQTLKACLLLPADEKTISELAHLAATVEREIERKEGTIGTDFHYTAWGCFAVALWHYRRAEYAAAADWAERCLAFPNDNDARIASMLIVRAMIEQKLGKGVAARASLGEGGDAVRKVFANKSWIKPKFPASWFEWLNAALLLSEAEQLAGTK